MFNAIYKYSDTDKVDGVCIKIGGKCQLEYRIESLKDDCHLYLSKLKAKDETIDMLHNDIRGAAKEFLRISEAQTEEIKELKKTLDKQSQ